MFSINSTTQAMGRGGKVPPVQGQDLLAFQVLPGIAVWFFSIHHSIAGDVCALGNKPACANYHVVALAFSSVSS